jgi:hypothetical protein
MTRTAIVVYPRYTALDFIGPYGTVETMHGSFQRTVRVTPGQYRRHFSPRTPA